MSKWQQYLFRVPFDLSASEFVLMLDNEESIAREESVVEPRLQSMVFRALEMEQKSTWRHLLEQRVKACRAQREYCL